MSCEAQKMAMESDGKILCGWSVFVDEKCDMHIFSRHFETHQYHQSSAKESTIRNNNIRNGAPKTTTGARYKHPCNYWYQYFNNIFSSK